MPWIGGLGLLAIVLGIAAITLEPKQVTARWGIGLGLATLCLVVLTQGLAELGGMPR